MLNPGSSHHSDILVVGGGVIGLACAYYLNRCEHSVRILEQETVGAGASHGNCGLIYVSDLPPLCAPGAIGQELIRTLRGTSPLYIAPRPDLALALWLLRFAGNCHPRHLQRAITAREALLRTSNALFADLFSRERLECDFQQKGVLMAFTDPAALDRYAATNRLMEPYGLSATRHDRDEIRQIEPALNDRVCGGWYHRADSHLRPETFVAAWARAARGKGVQIGEKCRVESFELHRGRVGAVRTTAGRFTADQFILAAGAWSPAIARQLGLRIPVQPGKGYSITMARPAACPGVPCYLAERNVVATPWQSGYRLGGTMEFSGFNQQLNQRRLDNLVSSAARYLQTPVGRPEIERWAGLRPMSPDDLPIIGRAPNLDNLTIATGHGMLGLSTATGTGRLVADLICGRRPICDPKPFSIQRFV